MTVEGPQTPEDEKEVGLAQVAGVEPPVTPAIRALYVEAHHNNNTQKTALASNQTKKRSPTLPFHIQCPNCTEWGGGPVVHAQKFVISYSWGAWMWIGQ